MSLSENQNSAWLMNIHDVIIIMNIHEVIIISIWLAGNRGATIVMLPFTVMSRYDMSHNILWL